VGDETIQFASRFSNALSTLAALSGDATHARLLRAHGKGLAGVVRDALDAVQAVHETGTKAVRNWPEQRQRVLAQVAALRAALERSGVDAEVRRQAGALVETIEPGSSRR